MSGFFSLDGAFYKYGTLVADILILSLAWIICSLPIITIGASTSALFYVTTRRIANREGYILRDFFNSFKTNFIKATVLWFMIGGVAIVLIINILNISVMGSMAGIILPLQICFFAELLLIAFYIFPIAARFDMNKRQILKSAFFMANRHLLTSLSCVALFASLLLGIYLYPPMLLVAPGLFAWLSSYMFMRVFKKYRPEMDKDPAQELAEIEAAIEAAKKPVDELHRQEIARIEAAQMRDDAKEAD
jgi:uncharacterized membrane protein YesL